MPMTSSDLIQARLLIDDILEDLNLDAYLFEIEPRNGHWELKVECAVDEGWGSYRVALDQAELHAGFDNETARSRLKEQCWRSLSGCRKNSGGRD